MVFHIGTRRRGYASGQILRYHNFEPGQGTFSNPSRQEKLFKLWGAPAFIAKSLMLLKALPDPKDEASLYTVQAPTGPRHLQVIDREQREKAAPAA